MNIFAKPNVLFGVTYSFACIGANTCICNQQEILKMGANLAHVKFHVRIVNISSNIKVTSHGLYGVSFHRLRDRLFKMLSRLITNGTFRAPHYWPLLLAPVIFPHKGPVFPHIGPVMWKGYSCYRYVIWKEIVPQLVSQSLHKIYVQLLWSTFGI